MRILMLGPWAIERPRHGGQIRADRIRSAYRARGHEVIFVGIYDPNNVEKRDVGTHDVAIDERVMDYIARSGKPWQMSLWQAFAFETSHFEHFSKLVQKFKPDIVQIEEPYLWPLVKTLRQKGYLKGARLIHSSYNFETEYRRDLAQIAGQVNEDHLELVAREERELAAECDLVVTVSESDAECFRRIGAKHVVVALNGCRTISANPDALKGVDRYMGDSPYALFVSSAHPPNVQGLLDFAGSAPSEMFGRLVICGSVCSMLNPHISDFPLLRHARLLGTIDVPILDALLTRASVILLPKTRGGGSNLKTSEALLAYRPVVATTHAFVGFEAWAAAKGVTIADEPTSFWDRTVHHLSESSPPGGSDWRDERKGLLWESCLAPMVRASEDMTSPALIDVHRNQKIAVRGSEGLGQHIGSMSLGLSAT
jgi:hypothetical protein